MKFHYDEDIVPLLWKKKRIALEWLYERYSGVVFGLSSRVAPSEEVAEELMVQAFVNIWARAEEASITGGGLLAWVLEVAMDTIRQAGDNGLPLGLSDEVLSLSLNKQQRGLLNHAMLKPLSEEELRESFQLSEQELGSELRKTILKLRGNQKINEIVSKK